jgi:hypothetical protein
MSILKRNLLIALPVVFFALFFAPPLRAQQTSTDDLKKMIEALGQGMKAMQKDLQDIKALLQSRAPAPAAPPVDIVLDLGGRPFRGQNTARLVLVEFSDYQ